MAKDRHHSSYLFTKLSQNEISAINSSKLASGLTPSECNYWKNLLSHGRKNSKANQDQYCLGKRLTANSSLPSLPQSLTYKMNFTKSLLESYQTSSSTLEEAQKVEALSKTTEQKSSSLELSDKNTFSICKLSFEDYYSSVTVVQVNKENNIILMGTNRGKVLAIFLYRQVSEADNDDNGLEPDNNQNDAGNTGEGPEDNNPEQERDDNREGDKIDGIDNNGQDPASNSSYSTNLSLFTFIGHSSPVTGLSIREDSQRFISGCLDGSVRLWDLGARECLRVLQGHFQTVIALSMAPKGGLFASAGSEGQIILWKENPIFSKAEASSTTHANDEGSCRLRDLVGHLNDVCHMEFTANLKYLVSSSLDSTLRVWEVETGECKRLIKLAQYFWTFTVSINFDLIIGGTEAGQLCFVDITKNMGNLFYACPITSHLKEGEEGKLATPRIRKICFSPDEKYFSVIKKDSVSVCSTETIFKYKAETELCEKKNDKDRMARLWKRDFREICLTGYENEGFDFVAQSFCFNNTVLVINRAPS